jgi:hypothetical protein
VALGLLQDHVGDIEQRVRPATAPDLDGHGLDALFVGQKAQIDLRQRFGRRPDFAANVLVAARTAVIAVLGSATETAGAAGTTRATRATWTSRTPALLAKRGRAIAARAARSTGAAPVITAGFSLALEIGVTIGGAGRPLRPRGQEELFQIELGS